MSSGRCWSSDTYNPCPGVMEKVPASNGYKGGFGTPLMSKVGVLAGRWLGGESKGDRRCFLLCTLQDLGLAVDAANATKTATPMGALANQIFRFLMAHGYDDKDFSSVFKFLEKQTPN